MSHNQEESRDSFAFVKSDAAYTFEALDEWNRGIQWVQGPSPRGTGLLFSTPPYYLVVILQ